VFCREHAAQLRGVYSEIQAAGADVVAIGTGNPMYAQAFVKDEQIPFTVLIDGDGDAARAASIKGGLGMLVKLASPSVIKAGKRAHAAGHRQGKTGDRPMQLGATFIVGPGDNIVYTHLDDDVGDHAPLADILAALKR
jgi:peroxiredoxin